MKLVPFLFPPAVLLLNEARRMGKSAAKHVLHMQHTFGKGCFRKGGKNPMKLAPFLFPPAVLLLNEARRMGKSAAKQVLHMQHTFGKGQTSWDQGLNGEAVAIAGSSRARQTSPGSL